MRAVVLLVLCLVFMLPVRAQEITPTPDGSYIIAADIYVRGGPGETFLPVGRLIAGNRVTPLNRSEDADWVLIRYGRGGFGWIRRDLATWNIDVDALPTLDETNLTPTPAVSATAVFRLFTPTPTGNWVRSDIGVFVRSGPGVRFPILGELSPGDTVEPVGRDSETSWILIRHDDGFAWLFRPLVQWSVDLTDLPVLFLGALTPSPTVTPSATPTSTYTPTPTNTPTATLTPSLTPSPTATLTPSATPTNTFTPTPTFTDTATPTDTVTPTPTATATFTPTDTPSRTPSFTPLPTNTPRPTATPTDTYTPLPTNTHRPSATPSATATNTTTLTPTPSRTPTATDTHTSIPSDTPTPSRTPTATRTNTPVPSDTPTATDTNTPVPSDTPTATNTATRTPSPTAAATLTPSATATNTATNTLTTSRTPTATPTQTASRTPTATRTAIQTVTSTATDQPTQPAFIIPTDEPTAAATQTPAPSDTPSPTDTATQPPTATNTRTLVPTDTPSLTPTHTATLTSTPIPTDTDTPAPTATLTNTPIPGEAAVATFAPPPSAQQPLDSGEGEPLRPELVIGSVALLAVLAYVALYWRGLTAMDRYADGFPVEICPVCGQGHLIVDTRQERVLGIPQPRFIVRCDVCRSTLRGVGYRRWRYAVDQAANPTLHNRLNGQVIDERTLAEFSRRAPAESPRFVDDADQPPGRDT